MLDIERNWIEGAARAMYSRALQQRVDASGITCSWCDKAARPDGELHRSADVRSHAATPFSDAPLPTDIRLQAARLMGMIEQANGMRINGICAAAAKADTDWMVAKHIRLMGSASMVGAQIVTGEYARDFGYALAMEAMGTGVRWADELAEVRLPARSFPSGRLMCSLPHDHDADTLMRCIGPASDRPLVVPRFDLGAGDS